jgi:hypothetical protein
VSYDSTADTKAHIREVQNAMGAIGIRLATRANVHDLSKLQAPEKAAFDVATPKLKGLTYGSPEYKAATDELGVALEHHYKANSHHPQHFPDGIDGMSLLDVVEMFCDWAAAVKRHDDGDLAKSIEINKERFGISDQLVSIFKNTQKEMGW